VVKRLADKVLEDALEVIVVEVDIMSRSDSGEWKKAVHSCLL